MKTIWLLLNLLAYVSVSASDVRFVPATPENTRLLDGSPVITKEGEGAWKWLPGEGNHGVFESYGDPKRNAPPLVLMVNDLEASIDYEVFGYFWARGFAEPKDPRASDKQPHHWPARFGLGLATLSTFGGKHLAEIPWILCPESKLATAREHAVTLEQQAPLVRAEPGWITAVDDLRLVRARLGISRADKNGCLPVYADDFPDSIHCGRTRLNGIGLKLAPAGAVATAGAGSSRALHFALRARDKLSVLRELESGADVNVLDASGLSTLYHPASTGDANMVKLLLSKGANPNLKGQSVLALTAAASTGDEDMVRLLLAAGAEVPAGKLDPAPWMSRLLDHSHLHPAIAAIRIGSPECLKAILEKRPELDLESLGRADAQVSNGETSRHLVEDAMAAGHDELAAFLVDRGCTLASRHFDVGTKYPERALLARAITEGESLVRTREALLRRGVSPVAQSNRFMVDIKPWDGLSAAVAVGDLALVKRFLGGAALLPANNQSQLLALAHWKGEPEILRLLGVAFPGTRPDWNPPLPETEKPASDTALRLLLPRTRPAPVSNMADRDALTLAVVPAPDEGGQSALLEVAASKVPGMTVVDRQNVRDALAEARFANPWGDGRHRLADLGDHLSADLLILASRLKGNKLELLRFEAVDVATGLPILREHIESKAFSSDAIMSALLSRIRSAFAKARAGKRVTALTMLPFTVERKVPNGLALSRLFDTAIHSEVDATPGLLAIGKDQIQAVADEQKLGGKERLWAAAFTLEGGVSPSADGNISLTLRLRPLEGGAEKAIDVTETGSASGIADLTTRAWRKLAASGLLAEKPPANIAPDARQARSEAARLLREAEWLVNAGFPEEAVPLCERADLLGAEPGPLIAIQLDALSKCIRVGGRSLQLWHPYNDIFAHPPSLRYQIDMLRHLDDIRKLLDQADYHMARHGAASLRWSEKEWSRKDCDFLHAVTLLSFYRACIPVILPDDYPKEGVMAFGEDLDRFTAGYFSLRSAMKEPDMLPANAGPFYYGPGSATMLRRNPQLLEGWTKMYFATSAGETAGTSRRNESSPNLRNVYSRMFGEQQFYHLHWYGLRQLMLDAISPRMDQYKGSYRALREAEIAWLRSRDGQRSSASRTYAQEMAKLGRFDLHYQGDWLGVDLSKRFGSSRLLEVDHPPVPRHADEIVAALAHEPKGSFDWIGHPTYEAVVNYLVMLEKLAAGDATKRLNSLNPQERYSELATAASRQAQAAQSVERLLGGALLWETVYGRPIHDNLMAKWKHLLKPLQGSNPQTAPLARLLVDLRQIDSSKPGMFKFPTIDNASGTKLWLSYQAFDDTVIQPAHDSKAPRRYPRRHPWLLGVDCVTGKLATTTNLAKSSGFNLMARNEESIGFNSDRGMLVQTNDMILTTAEWVPSDPKTPLVCEKAVMVRKDGGQIIPIDPEPNLGRPEDVVLGTGESAAAVALGKDFYLLRRAGGSGDPDEDRSLKTFEILRVTPAGDTSAVTLFGRRPQKTPFDPLDRYPKMILRDGERLLVIHNREHSGHFHPDNDSWDADPSGGVKRMETARNLVNADFRSHIFPHHRIKAAGSPDCIVRHDSLFPDTISVSVGGAEKRIALRLEIPAGFASQPLFGAPVKVDMSSDGTGTYAYPTYDSSKETDKLGIVVINQTANDLILGLQIGKEFKWYPGKRTGAFLPMIWALPKAELLAVMKKG